VTALNVRKVRELFRARWRAAVPTAPPDERVQYENRRFDVPSPEAAGTEALWLREWLTVHASVRNATGSIQHNGTYQLDVFFPANRGTEAIEDLAKLLLEAFEPALGLTDGASTTLLVEEAVQSSITRGVGDLHQWAFLPVQFDWRSHTLTSNNS
jgi:hypothetical protein